MYVSYWNGCESVVIAVPVDVCFDSKRVECRQFFLWSLKDLTAHKWLLLQDKEMNREALPVSNHVQLGVGNIQPSRKNIVIPSQQVYLSCKWSIQHEASKGVPNQQWFIRFMSMVKNCSL